jgi:hypothetical protein
MRKAKLLLVAVAAMAPVPAMAEEMCEGLRRIAAAAGEPAPFASLAGELYLLPGFEGHCRVRPDGGDGGNQVFCHRTLAPASLEEELVGRQLRDCLGATYIPGPNQWVPGVYRTAQLEISYNSNCDERCQVGRSATMMVTRRRAEGTPK